eukprot:1156402-Pelagomonas_calceolata.AAC.10
MVQWYKREDSDEQHEQGSVVQSSCPIRAVSRGHGAGVLTGASNKKDSTETYEKGSHLQEHTLAGLEVACYTLTNVYERALSVPTDILFSRGDAVSLLEGRLHFLTLLAKQRPQQPRAAYQSQGTVGCLHIRGNGFLTAPTAEQTCTNTQPASQPASQPATPGRQTMANAKKTALCACHPAQAKDACSCV